MNNRFRIHKSAIINHTSSALSATSAVILLVFFTGHSHAASVILRDSIGPDTTLTDGLTGGSTLHFGALWFTSAFVLDVAEAGVLSGARVVVFGRDLDNNPENDLLDIYDYSMDFHVWSDGIQGGPDSFFDNAIGNAVGNHVNVSINSTSASVISVEEWGATGPPINPTMFKTFLVTIDLSSFGIALQSGQQYVAAVIDPDLGPIDRGISFRVIASRATGFEDLYQQYDTNPLDRPGYLVSQHNFPFEQYAAKLTLGNGDFDGDDDVDGRDFLVWQRNFGFDAGEGNVAPDSFGNTNADRYIDGKDLAIWQATYGTSWAGSLSANATVPEPSGLVLLLLAAVGLVSRRS